MINWFTWISMVVVFCFTIWVIQHYASRSTAKYVYVFVFLGYFLAFLLVVLIPYDIYLSIAETTDDIKDRQSALMIFWRIMYWTVFALCWVILPVIQEYEMAGDFEWPARLKSALFRHIRAFIITTILGLIVLIYLFFKGDLTIESTPVFLMVLSNCWGLLLIIILLGYGLVEIPRQFWQAGNNSSRLSNLYIKATSISEAMTETKFALDENVKLVNAASYILNKSSDQQEHLNYILSLCPIEVLEHQRAMQSHLSKDAIKQLGDIDEKRLVKLHKDLKDTLSEYQRSKYKWDEIIEEALNLEDIINACDSPFKRIAFSFKDQRQGFGARKIEVIEWFWLTKARPLTFRILGGIFFIMSILVILGESTLFIDTPIGVFPMMFENDHGIVLSQALCFIPLSYIILCTYFGLFNLKLSGWYGLYPNNHTDPSNLVWSAFFLARLSAPLCYNFLLYLKIENSVYSRVMKLINVVPFVGAEFTTFFPMLLILFAALNLFHVYGRFMGALGMGQLSFSDKFMVDKVADGKLLVQRNRVEREKKYSNYNRSNLNVEMVGNLKGEDARKGLPFRRVVV